MRATLSVFLLLGLIAFSLQVKSCFNDAGCNQQYYCSKRGFCAVKYDNFCNSDADCNSPKEMCAQQQGYERGVCVDNAYLYYYESKNLEPKFEVASDGVEMEHIEPLTMDEIAKLPRPYQRHDAKDFCGMDHAIFRHFEPLMNQTNGCEVGECDYAVNRDKFTTSPNKKFRLQWLVIVDGVFSEQAKTKIATVTGELNFIYGNTGFQFESTISYFNSPYANSRVGLLTCTSTTNPCVGAMDLVTHLRGTAWQSQGAFQVLTLTPENENTNGAAMFPWYSNHGLVLMNPRVLVAGSTTMPHEMGHALGLRHTFAGVSEVPAASCATCFESVASDSTGDFCSDTQPVARNWACTSSVTVTDANSCNTQSAWNNNPFTNLMSYGTCRKDFSPQQIRRMRCWFTKFKYNFTA